MWTYYNEIPISQIYYYYGDFEDILFNMTELVSNSSSNLDKCVSASQDVYNFLESQIDEFGSVSAYNLALFQNVVANIITISMIYQNIVTDTAPGGNTTDAYFMYGRIANIVLDVKPIATGLRSSPFSEMIQNGKNKTS